MRCLTSPEAGAVDKKNEFIEFCEEREIKTREKQEGGKGMWDRREVIPRGTRHLAGLSHLPCQSALRADGLDCVRGDGMG